LRRRDRPLEEDAGAAEGLPGAGLDPGGVAAGVDLLADLDRRMSSVAAMISGPMPSPWATVTAVRTGSAGMDAAEEEDIEGSA
jgi:hypothetical protein